MINTIQIVHIVYLISSALIIFGLKQMSSPKTARSGMVLARNAMIAAVIVTLFLPEIKYTLNYLLMFIAIIVGGGIAWYAGKTVKMIQMPQMIALFNGMGGGAAGAIASIELLNSMDITPEFRVLSILGGIIGTLSFSGSIIAYAKLQDLIKRTIVLPLHILLNIVLVLLVVFFSVAILYQPNNYHWLIAFFSALILLGITFTLPIGGANMPIVISLFNAMTGLAVGVNGFVLHNPALIIAGIIVGASGTLLTQLMAKAMNKNIGSILFSPLVKTETAEVITSGSLKPIDAEDAAIMLAYANKVIITPGYGMAVAQAQHKTWELTQLLEKRGVTVKFAIHPVAGRMPGHMNVLLAEAGVPYDKIFDMDEINPEFPNTDVALVIGANDVVNPAAKNQANSPIYGMPVLNVGQAKNVLVIKRGQGKGFSGIENSLFTMDQSRMLYGSGQDALNQLIQALKNLE